ncbi:MAG: NUDIX hydrolase [Caldilineales bacterium]|nr:NUDIX hydrolase [Caldilineales bacterium]
MQAPEFRFCPQCAHELDRKALYGRERAYCPACGFVHFREPKLSVGGLVSENGRVLLIRRAVAPRIGFWAVPSGFVEFDEQPRRALAREIIEETGLEVRVGGVIDVFANADAAKPGVFLLFEAHPTGGRLNPGDDVSDARWFRPDEIPWDDLAFGHMSEVLRQKLEAMDHD